jgi:hypothetical protein
MSEQSQSPKIKIQDIKFELINWSNPQLHHELLRQFHEICCLEFNESEMEKLSVWEHLVKSQDEKFPYRMSLTIAFYNIPTKSNNSESESESLSSCASEKTTNQVRILGGVDQEYYPKSNCGLMPYVVVSKEARGLGLASLLVQKGFEALNKISRSPPYEHPEGIEELFIELSQKSDSKDDGNPYHSYEAAETRHKIWGRIGFVGLEFSFHHPGYLRNTAHQLTIYRPIEEESVSTTTTDKTDKDDDDENNNKSKSIARRTRPVSSKIISLFIRDLFRGILMQEDEEEKTDQEADSALIPELNGREFVKIGEWR